jgi:hypothetical protein
MHPVRYKNSTHLQKAVKKLEATYQHVNLSLPDFRCAMMLLCTQRAALHWIIHWVKIHIVVMFFLFLVGSGLVVVPLC